MRHRTNAMGLSLSLDLYSGTNVATFPRTGRYQCRFIESKSDFAHTVQPGKINVIVSSCSSQSAARHDINGEDAIAFDSDANMLSGFALTPLYEVTSSLLMINRYITFS